MNVIHLSHFYKTEWEP